MSGEMNLDKLLCAISPRLNEGEFVFCTVKDAMYGDYADTGPIASFTEQEGLTLVIRRDAAEKHGLPYDGVYRCITLDAHSSLEAVGLTAAVSTALAGHGISANVIAGYFHDHIFVQSELANAAIGILSGLGN